ncbi:hypothetical protein KUH03_14380 [Sphingobacterium sp. E70]|uniref:hypothetical protein n=1 Tax=Sphingobacterium sp. E70 TaxID=2853439 RepID=UPI00211BE94C|nr:hypothetical protein [Sphingobacterium sp. E70]ULT29238.1 hypothetical protein KUH03_14380 [Sphingobacterium sp. E70]
MNSPYSKHFDIDTAITYLTTPGSGLLSRETKQWRAQRDQEFHDSNTTLREQQGLHWIPAEIHLDNSSIVRETTCFCQAAFLLHSTHC